MRKKKLILTKETVKNLTLGDEELGAVVGGGGISGVSGVSGVSINPGTIGVMTEGGPCGSVHPSCRCPMPTGFTSVINPGP